MPTRVLITSSRSPNAAVRSLVKDIASVVPGSIRLSRGKAGFRQLQALALELKVKNVLLIERSQGAPGRLQFLRVETTHVRPELPLLDLKSVTLRRNHMTSRDRIRSLSILEPEEPELRRIAAAFANKLEIPMVRDIEEQPSGSASLRLSAHESSLGLLTFYAEERQIGPTMILSRAIWDSPS
ncbi:MAG: hypothetical protein ACE5KO_05090 [Candidatus Bathyarchaeia archaeon]